MKANRLYPDTASAPLDVANLQAKFLALMQQKQRLDAEIADWNRKKAHHTPRRWSKKRQLTPPSAEKPSPRARGAQPYNSNRLNHGRFARSSHLFSALIRSQIHTGHTLVALVRRGIPLSLTQQ